MYSCVPGSASGIFQDLNSLEYIDLNKTLLDTYKLESSYDLKMIEFDSSGMPKLALNMEKYVDAVNKLYSLNYETEGVNCCKEISDNNEMTDLCSYFSQDHLVFINIIPAYYDEALKNKYSRDADRAESAAHAKAELGLRVLLRGE